MEIQYPVKLSQKAFGQGKREFVIKDKHTIDVTTHVGGVLQNFRVDPRHLDFTGKRYKYSSPQWIWGAGMLVVGIGLFVLGVTAPSYTDRFAMGMSFGTILGIVGFCILAASISKNFDHYYYYNKYSGGVSLPMIFNKPDPGTFEKFQQTVESLMDKPNQDEGKGLLFQHSDS